MSIRKLPEPDDERHEDAIGGFCCLGTICLVGFVYLVLVTVLKVVIGG